MQGFILMGNVILTEPGKNGMTVLSLAFSQITQYPYRIPYS